MPYPEPCTRNRVAQYISVDALVLQSIMTSRNYCFTLHFADDADFTGEEYALYHAEELGQIFSAPLFRYVIVNVEKCPDTSRIHWQGYMELTKPVRFAAVKTAAPLLSTAHFEARRGTREQAIAYCSKTDSQVAGPFTYGSAEGGQGFRSDLAEAAAAVQAGASMHDVAQQFPETFVRYHSGLAALRNALNAKVEPEANFVPNTWQAHLLNLLAEPADDRRIIWVTDTVGGRGKTRMATHLMRNCGAMRLTGKMHDMAHAWVNNPAPIAVFDITRAAADLSSHLYTMGETLKSGFIFSGKYQSGQLQFPPPHVVYFSNQSWDREKFSHDRVLEIDLSHPDWA